MSDTVEHVENQDEEQPKGLKKLLVALLNRPLLIVINVLVLILAGAYCYNVNKLSTGPGITSLDKVVAAP
ncbi:MAG: hypothetical protein HQK59_17420, partial [Deltaproteobacteria bacterium]|nr:hypothetical protein [Deltaproteobacteria bacterium]